MAYIPKQIEDFLLEVPTDNIEGMFSINKFGANAAIAQDTTEDVWDGGGTYVFPTTADITHISERKDQVAMRGQNIEVQGLDANWDRVTQTIALNATDTTTAVTLVTPLIRCFRMKVMANVLADGDIAAHNVGDTIDYAVILALENQTLMAIYTVPAGYTGYVTKYYCTSIESTGKEPKSTRFKLKVADRGNNYEFQIKHIVGIPKAGSMVEHEFIPYAGKVLEKSDIKISANPVDEIGDVAAGFDLILVAN